MNQILQAVTQGKLISGYVLLKLGSHVLIRFPTLDNYTKCYLILSSECRPAKPKWGSYMTPAVIGEQTSAIIKNLNFKTPLEPYYLLNNPLKNLRTLVSLLIP